MARILKGGKFVERFRVVIFLAKSFRKRKVVGFIKEVCWMEFAEVLHKVEGFDLLLGDKFTLNQVF